MLKIKTKKLSRDYFIFAAIIAATLVGISILWTVQTYNSLNKDKEQRFQTESEKVSGQLLESFNYLESFMQVIANDISRLNPATPSKIAPYLERSWPKMKTSGENYFSWSVLDFSDPSGRILASSLNGVMAEPTMLPKDRAWLTEGPKNPGKLIFSTPDIGVITNQYVMPVGFGITDRNGKYIGAISISFNIESLTRKLATTIDKRVSFALLDNTNSVILRSDKDGKNTSTEQFQPEKLTEMKDKSGRLKNPIKLNGTEYYYYQKLPHFPFIILTGSNDYFQDKEMSRLLWPRLQVTIILGVFFLLLLYFFQRKIIHPVEALTQAALDISKGKTDVVMPQSDIHEYQVLSQQLGNIREIISRLTKAQSDLQEALRAKSTFLSNMSHELRTPLNAVIGFSESIKKKIFGDIGNDKYNEYASDINEQGQYLLKMIEEILDASKIESGKAELYEEPLSFSRLLRDCLKTVQQRADAKQIKLITEAKEDLPYIKADKTKLKQVMLNLLSNGIKFTATSGKIFIRAYVDKDFVIEVQDTGIGIAKEDLKKIAQRFAQVENIYTRKTRGTGLGMSITKDLVEMHGGKFLIESEPNIGTKITIRLPAERIIFSSQYVQES